MVSERLKQLIFKQLYKELGKVEIIPYKNSIWFIDRENKYWFFEYNDEYLWWRYNFFPSFFSVFSLEREDYEPILSSWVEEVLNHKVSTTSFEKTVFPNEIDEVLNQK